MSFEPLTGWMPVNTLGTVWRYRGRGVFGLFYFKMVEGQRLYEVTHQDHRSNDTSLMTAKRKAAVRFAETGDQRRHAAETRKAPRE